MTIEVISVGKPWTPPDAGADFKPIYTLIAKDDKGVSMGEPIKTQDPLLASVGKHHAESYPTKSGKTYWRTITPSTPQTAPEAPQSTKAAQPVTDTTRESIERQQALIQAVAFVNGQTEYNENVDRLATTLSVAEDFAQFLRGGMAIKAPETLDMFKDDPLDDFDPEEDLPPVENYEGME